MSSLKSRMEADLRIQNYRPSTQREYVRNGYNLARHFMKSPAEMGELPAGGTGDLILLRGNAEFRTNVGLVNLGTAETVARVTLYGPSGAPLTSWGRILPPLGHHQDDDVFAPFGSFPEGEIRAEVTVVSGPGPVAAYASVIDRRSGDPTTVQAKRRE